MCLHPIGIGTLMLQAARAAHGILPDRLLDSVLSRKDHGAASIGMIDLLNEEVLSLSQAARCLPRLRKGRPVNTSTLWRWSTIGFHGIRLETAKLGGRNVTSREALNRFFNALNDNTLPACDVTNNQEAVERQLAKLGL